VAKPVSTARLISVAGVAVLLLMPTVGAFGAPDARTVVAKKPPPGIPGQIYAVSAVPNSSDAWVIAGSADGFTAYFALRHNGKWRKVNPGLGHGGVAADVAAGSTTAAWVIGRTSGVAKTNPGKPTLTRWNGKKFRPVKLAHTNGKVNGVAASSAINAWVFGDPLLSTAKGSPQVAAHWNGKTWSMVRLPKALGSEGVLAISTSSASNAWAIGMNAAGYGILLHWNGKVWKVDGSTGFGVDLASVATSSPKHAVAVGSVNTSKGSSTYLLSFNGKKWVHVNVPSPGVDPDLVGVTMTGTSAWAVGGYTQLVGSGGQGGDVAETMTLHTSGGKWKIQPDAVGQGRLDGVSAESAKRVYEVGERGTSTFITSFSIYNGHKWAVEPAKP
jgi:hypothetical protein